MNYPECMHIPDKVCAQGFIDRSAAHMAELDAKGYPVIHTSSDPGSAFAILLIAIIIAVVVCKT